MEVASFSQGEVLNYTEIAREVGSNRQTISNYFDIIEDLLLGYRVFVFNKRAKRELISHPKFYYFDVGVYRTIRPRGPLDYHQEIDGAALETLFFQEIKAINDYFDLGYEIFFWRTKNQIEVDFVLYGENGLFAFEIKRSDTLKKSHFNGLKQFSTDYPVANLYMLYGGNRKYYENNVLVIPYVDALKNMKEILQGNYNRHGC
jgi:predicted AAA+ superfamily ATPase